MTGSPILFIWEYPTPTPPMPPGGGSAKIIWFIISENCFWKAYYFKEKQGLQFNWWECSKLTKAKILTCNKIIFICGTNLICTTNHKKRAAKFFTFQRWLQGFLQSQELRLKPQERLDDASTFSKIHQNAFSLLSFWPIFDLVPSRPTNPQSNYDGAAV